MPTWYLLLALVFILANGLFVAAEFAAVKVRPTQLAEKAAEGSARARMARRITKRLDSYLPYDVANWYFTPPYHEFTISEGENLVALVIFLVVGGVVSLLVATASPLLVFGARCWSRVNSGTR